MKLTIDMEGMSVRQVMCAAYEGYKQSKRQRRKYNPFVKECKFDRFRIAANKTINMELAK